MRVQTFSLNKLSVRSGNTRNNVESFALVIAGGGGGGGSNGGGGGAGGYMYVPVMLSGTTNVTVGAGGSGGIGWNSAAANKGGNSVFGTITSIGGGAGATEAIGGKGMIGGSGGGGNGWTGGANFLGAAGTAGQGNAGGRGNSLSPNYWEGGGGGGAGAAGQDGKLSTPYRGGDGGEGRRRAAVPAIVAAAGRDVHHCAGRFGVAAGVAGASVRAAAHERRKAEESEERCPGLAPPVRRSTPRRWRRRVCGSAKTPRMRARLRCATHAVPPGPCPQWSPKDCAVLRAKASPNRRAARSLPRAPWGPPALDRWPSQPTTRHARRSPCEPNRRHFAWPTLRCRPGTTSPRARRPWPRRRAAQRARCRAPASDGPAARRRPPRRRRRRAWCPARDRSAPAAPGAC